MHAVQANAAPQFFYQMLADRQAQAGAAIAPGHLLAGLDEAVEDPGLHSRLDADAIVADRHPHALRALVTGQYLHHKPHLAVFGELDGIGQQVAEHLAQVLFGTVLVFGQLLVDVQLQGVAIVPGHGFEQRQHFLAQLA